MYVLSLIFPNKPLNPWNCCIIGRKVEIGFFENFLAPLWHLAVLVGYYKSVIASITIKKIAQTRRLLLYTHRRPGVSSLGVPGGAWYPQILADQLTLPQPGGADYAHLIILAPPDFQILLRPWRHITCQVSEQSLQFYRISYEKKAKELPDWTGTAEEMVENAR